MVPRGIILTLEYYKQMKQRGDHPWIEEIIKSYEDFFKACKSHNLANCTDLLSRGLNVNAQDVNKTTGLMHAVLALNGDTIHDHEMKKIKDGHMWRDSRSRHENVKDTIKLLLKSGADPNRTNILGNTALIVATNQKIDDLNSRVFSNSVIEILLDSGADPNIKNNLGETALMKAVKAGNNETVKILFRRKHGYIDILLAVEYG